MDGSRHPNAKMPTRRSVVRGLCRLLPIACAAPALLLPACTIDGQLTVLGYSTRPNYDPNIHTVRVPIFENRTYRRGLEFTLTESVVREINLKTPFRVVGVDQQADTELRGKIIGATKGILNLNQLGELREGQNDITVELSWVDLRTGEVLSKPGRRFGEPLAEPLVPPALSNGVPGAFQPAIITPPSAPGSPSIAAAGDGTSPPLPGTPGCPDPNKPPVIRLHTVSSYIPELNQSTTSGFQEALDKMAVQIVSMMEKPW